MKHRCRSLTASARSAYKSTWTCHVMCKSMQSAYRVTITSELCDRTVTICRPIVLRQWLVASSDLSWFIVIDHHRRNYVTLLAPTVCSRLDYCNSLLHNISKKNIQKLQRIQNNLTRVVLKAPRWTSPESMLASLHWLPVAYRIQYKLAIITFKALTVGQPTYFADLLHRRVTVRHPRSPTSDSLIVPSIRKRWLHVLSVMLHQPSATIYLTMLEKRHQ